MATIIGNKPAEIKLILTTNDDYKYSATITNKETGAPVDLTGKEIKLGIYDAYPATRQNQTYKFTATISDAVNGKFYITIPREITGKITRPTCYSTNNGNEFMLGFVEVKIKDTATDLIESMIRGKAYVRYSSLEW